MSDTRPSWIGGRGSALLFITVLVAGCKPDWREVHSPTRPGNITYDEMTWSAVARSAPDEWLYVPEVVAVAGRQAVPAAGSYFDVLVKDKVWRVWSLPNGGVNLEGPVDAPHLPPDSQTALTWLGLILLCVICMAMTSTATRTSKTARQKATQAERSVQGERERQAEFERKQAQAEAELAAARRALNAEREELEQAKRAHSVLLRSWMRNSAEFTREQYRKQSAAVRDVLVTGSGLSRELVVKYALDTKRAEAPPWPCGFEWEIVLNRPVIPTLTVSRNGAVIRRESGTLKGHFGDILIPGKRYTFVFALSDGTREFPDPLLIELTPPPFEAFTPEPPPKVSDEERKRRKAAAYRDRSQYAQASIKDPDRLQQKLAQIQQELNEEFGEG